MKIILATITTIAFFLCTQIQAQSKILKINFGEDQNQFMMYPPNTKFNVIDDDFNIVFSDKSDFGVFEIKQKY